MQTRLFAGGDRDSGESEPNADEFADTCGECHAFFQWSIDLDASIEQQFC
jgi:hypothetical protein